MVNHILLVDDDAINNFIVLNNIVRAGIAKKTSSAVNGQEAIQLLRYLIENDRKELPQIILLDLNMPVMDGWEFVEEYRKIDLEIRKNIRLYMVSSSVYEEDIQRAKLYPEIIEFISKPLKSQSLQRLVK